MPRHIPDMVDVLPPRGEIIDDPYELAHRMGRIALAAPGVDAEHLAAGWLGYSAVTWKVARRTELKRGEPGAFQDPAKMLYTMPRFARPAINAMWNFMEGKDLGAWGPLYEEDQDLPKGLAMAKFMYVHVKYDLGPVLFETNTLERHKHDYTDGINGILREVGDELLPKFVEFRPPFNPLLKRLRVDQLGKDLVIKELVTDRDLAWDISNRYRAAQALPEQEKLRVIAQIDEETRAEASNGIFSSRSIKFLMKAATRTPEAFWDLADAA